ncbi:family 50 glycosyltransferase [Meredithblackwellia eburnea MCA 4105]
MVRVPSKDSQQRGLAFALISAGILRAILIIWSFYQDNNHSVKYTDIDYVVFSDAARCLIRPSSAAGCTFAQGDWAPSWLGDPYSRETYRYTPLLAMLVTPNILVHPALGKIIFASADLILGYVLHTLLRQGGSNPSFSNIAVATIWLLNPIIANISTRGSSESIVGLLVIGTLAFALQKRWSATAMAFGLAVHLKVFPIIYGSSLLVTISPTRGERSILTWRHVRFALESFATFMLLNGIMYALWGPPFLENTFLYHIRRLDHRHNFSPYFHAMYLSSVTASPSSWLTAIVRNPLASFVPQLGLSVGLGFIFGAKDLPFAWFIQTFAFVTLNKVCTSQYFLWYLWFLPLVIPRVGLSLRKSLVLLGCWIGGQALWLSQAYRLEMLGEPTYFNVWAAGVCFLVINCWVLGEVIGNFEPSSSRKDKVE